MPVPHVDLIYFFGDEKGWEIRKKMGLALKVLSIVVAPGQCHQTIGGHVVHFVFAHNPKGHGFATQPALVGVAHAPCGAAFLLHFVRLLDTVRNASAALAFLLFDGQGPLILGNFDKPDPFVARF